MRTISRPKGCAGRSRWIASYCHASQGEHLSQRGAQARVLWPFIVAHSPYPGSKPRPTWANNATLSTESGLTQREVERGIAYLRDAGRLATDDRGRLLRGARPGTRRGRLLIPQLLEPIMVLVPRAHEMARLWEIARARRDRPTHLVAAAVALHAVAAHERDRRPVAHETLVKMTGTDLARMLWLSHKGEGWSLLVAELASIGVIGEHRRGRWAIRPPRGWGRVWDGWSWRAPPQPAGRPAPPERCEALGPDAEPWLWEPAQ